MSKKNNKNEIAIRSSAAEYLTLRRFYQKITDIYSTSIDYDLSATATQRFYATVQNKLHWALSTSYIEIAPDPIL